MMRAGNVDEDAVGLDRRDELDARQPGDRCPRQSARHRVGVRRMAQPGAAVEHRDPRRCEVPHLRRELPALLAPPSEFLAERPIEEHDRLAERHAVLRAAEGQHVHAGALGDVGGMAAQRGDGIREPRAVQVHLHAAFVGERRKAPRSSTGVYTVPSSVACVRASARGREPCSSGGVTERAATACRRQLRMRRLDPEELRAAAEELGRTALVDVDVRERVAEHGVAAAADRGERRARWRPSR